MATIEQITYIPVPPPPLPEFYLPKQQRHHRKSSSSSTSGADVVKQKLVMKETVTSTDGTYDGRPDLGSIPSKPFLTVPPPRHGNDIPPLAIYHICRICLRTRSPRYHREHPIPIDGVPPPPGICRRCRVSSLEETQKVAEVVFQSESNPVKIGCITPFVPDDDIVSNEEMRRMKLERYLRGKSGERCRSRHTSKSQKAISFRHVKVVDEPGGDGSEDEETEEEVIVPRKRKVVFTAQDAIESFNDAPIPQAPTAPKVATTSMQVQPTTKPPSVSSRSVKVEALQKIDSAKAFVSTQASSSSTKSGSVSTVRASAKASAHTGSEYVESDIRRVARDEIERFARTMQEPKQRDSEIRRVAREEIERYRQAERKLEAHPQAFARGRLVPVERRIDIERDSAEPTPWMQPVRKDESVAKVSSKPKSNSEAARRDSAYESVSMTAKGDPAAAATSWSIQRRREVSIDRDSRHQASSQATESRRNRIATEKKTPTGTNKEESDKPASVKLHEVYDKVQESDPPRWSSRAEPYVVEVRRQQSQDMYNTIEVAEEIDLPPRSRAASYRRPQPGTDKSARPRAPVSERIRELRADPGRKEEPMQDSASSRRMDKEQDNNGSESNQRTRRDYWYDEATVRTSNTKSTQPYASSNISGPRQKSQIQFTSPVIERSAPASTHSRVTFQADRNSDTTRWPKEQSIDEEHRSPKASVGNRLPYPEDNLMPSGTFADAGKTFSSRTRTSRQENSAKDPNSEYIYIERTVQPADRRRGSRPFDDAPPEERVEMEETLVVRRRPEAEAPSRQRRRGRDKKDMRDSDESNHVKFNSKVEISPTPPGSDASSSEFRSFHSIGPQNHRQIDGNEDAGRPRDIISEYERRGRTRSRNSKPQYFHERETIYEKPDGQWIVEPGHSHGKVDDRPREGAWVSGGRPLHRALSESPSREELMTPSRYRRSDGRGPYREQEKITDSMRVENGSRDTIRGSIHGSIGEAAQVRW